MANFFAAGNAVAVDHRMLPPLTPRRFILEPRRPMSGE